MACYNCSGEGRRGSDPALGTEARGRQNSVAHCRPPPLCPPVFAYGAMGAGKTHTLVGHHGDPGIMYLTTVELYRLLEALQEEKPFEVLVSYLEVRPSLGGDWGGT